MNGFCHAEIPSKDYDKAGRFYKAVFGWETQHIPEMNYAMYKTPSGISGGFNKELEINTRAGVLLYIEVEDIETTLNKIEENGGNTAQGKTEIAPEMGFFALFSDSEGNSLGLWAKA
ncbi:MAG: VOC family protein [Candidatus Zixiibacteriota bacterium]|nr:MAG: VOC family protein [candidate division Zixibacteria bacterium]HHI03537.1 VOC family protein [candidate division Zixibacteria bacterium]